MERERDEGDSDKGPLLDHLWDALSDDVLRAPAEEILADALEDYGGDPEALFREGRQLADRAIRHFRRTKLARNAPD